MSKQSRLILHVDLAEWAERNLVDPDGRELRLEAFQRDMLRRIASGERVVLYEARGMNPSYAATLAALLEGGAVVFAGGLAQAERVYDAAKLRETGGG